MVAPEHTELRQEFFREQVTCWGTILQLQIHSDSSNKTTSFRKWIHDMFSGVNDGVGVTGKLKSKTGPRLAQISVLMVQGFKLGVVHKWRHTLMGEKVTKFVTNCDKGEGESVVLWCYTSRFDMHATRSHTRKERYGGQYVSIPLTIVFCCNQQGNFCRYC